MANEEQVAFFHKNGVKLWNEWKEQNPTEHVDFSYADFSGLDLSEVNLVNVILFGANLERTILHGATAYKADFSFANLQEATLTNANLFETKFYLSRLDRSKWMGAEAHRSNFIEASFIDADMSNAGMSESDFISADLSRSNLYCANLESADLSRAVFRDANLSSANLRRATLVETNFEGTNLDGCKIYGISAWNLNLDKTIQTNLTITPQDEPGITVDNLEVAQFTYLILNNQKLRSVIDTITSKAVLILGRFTPERKLVLDAIRDELRRLNFVPIMFDFERPTDRDFTETIMTLAGMCRFIIADITNPSSSPLELQATVPDYRIPFVPIIQEGQHPFAMFKDLYGAFDWVLKPLKYDTCENLIKHLEKAVVKPALDKHKELAIKKAQDLETRSLNDYE